MPHSKRKGEELPLYCLQFHPEVYHSVEGKKILKEFSGECLWLRAGLDPCAFYP